VKINPVSSGNSNKKPAIKNSGTPGRGNNRSGVTSYGKNSQFARGKREAVAYLKANPNATTAMVSRALGPQSNNRRGPKAPMGLNVGAVNNTQTTAYMRGMIDAVQKVKSGAAPKRSAAQTTARAITANRKAGVTAASTAAVKAKKQKTAARTAARMEGQAYGAAFAAIPKKKGK
jgi:hypothetical protein